MDLEVIKQKIAEIVKKYNLDLVVLFGSQATGNIHSKSDVDIGYVSPKHLDFTTRFEIVTDLHSVFEREDVELVNLRMISPLMKKIIADEGILLYERTQGMFVQFRMYAFKLYVETKPLRELRYQSLRRFAYGKTK